MIQKGAANLRMPQLQAALTIPRLSTRLHLFFSQINVRPALIAACPATMAALQRMLQSLQQGGLITPTSVTFVSQQSWSTVQQAIADVMAPVVPQDERELLEQEFRELQNAAEHGAPAQAAATPGSPPYFEVIRSMVVTGVARRSGGIEFRVTPVSRLRVVLVQRGYIRLDETGVMVSNAFHDGANRRTWYPGVELFGEGIFIDVDPNGAQGGRLPLTGAQADAWMAARVSNVPDTPGAETHPVHVWWHTLSHRLINALAVDSGYSAAAIRERIYVQIDLNGDARGGVLLYTVQPGGDGTLGGLISLVPTFLDVLHAALRDDLNCSNDPLCGDEQFDAARVNGSACYACLLISETSCEHRNRWLDRNLLISNPP